MNIEPATTVPSPLTPSVLDGFSPPGGPGM
jgi:hypothetical protein